MLTYAMLMLHPATNDGIDYSKSVDPAAKVAPSLMLTYAILTYADACYADAC